MNASHRHNSLEELIRRAIARKEALSFDLAQWCRKNQRQVDEFQAQKSYSPSELAAPISLRIGRPLKIAVAALVFLAVCLGLPYLDGRGRHNTAFAQLTEQIEKAKAITWKITFYNQVTSQDGKRTWIETETREQAYKAPGLYRDVHFDKQGRIHHWTVTDAIGMKEISINPIRQTAFLRELATGTDNPRGPFFWVKEVMEKRNLQWVGRRTTAGKVVNIFRTSFRDEANNEDWSYDFWIDAKTKRLVATYVPGADIYDPENDPARGNPREDVWSFMKPVCSAKYDIDFDAELDDSLFRLEPPAGYAVEVERRAYVTEEEMIRYLGILAEYHANTFPDQVLPFDVTSDKLNAITSKAKEDRTPAEQKLRETTEHYMRAGLNEMPVAHFLGDHALKDSFRYLGKGVKLGDKDRIVCWYRLKDSATYRVVYGDLSVKNMVPTDLPLPVEP